MRSYEISTTWPNISSLVIVVSQFLPSLCYSHWDVIVCSRLEKIQRDFLWGGGNLEKKPHLVNWKTVCLQKSSGGLGVRNLSKMNIALFCKWCWR